MSSPELVAPARLEDLLAGAFPETEDEARLQGLARELRSVSTDAPASLRERVAAIGVSAQPRLRRPSRRLAVALAAALFVLAAGVVAALRSTGDQGSREHATATTKAGQSALSDASAPRSGAVFGAASGDRAQDVDMWVDLRVQDAERVSGASQDAVRITRELGGVVTSSNVETRGKQGHAQLTLRIPVAKLDDAVFRLTQLGIVTAQRTNTQDLQAPLDRVKRRIQHLRGEIRIERARLASGQLDPAEELEARIHLEHLRANLESAKHGRATLLSRTSMADLTLRLATPAPGAVEKSESGVAGAAHQAADFLRGAGAVAVFLALVLSPLVAFAIVAWLLLRVRSRRIEARLLEERRPGTSIRSS